MSDEKQPYKVTISDIVNSILIKDKEGYTYQDMLVVLTSRTMYKFPLLFYQFMARMIEGTLISVHAEDNKKKQDKKNRYFRQNDKYTQSEPIPFRIIVRYISTTEITVEEYGVDKVVQGFCQKDLDYFKDEYKNKIIAELIQDPRQWYNNHYKERQLYKGNELLYTFWGTVSRIKYYQTHVITEKGLGLEIQQFLEQYKQESYNHNQEPLDEVERFITERISSIGG